MVRTKTTATRQDANASNPFAVEVATTSTMGISKCHACEIAMDRPGEKRPSTRCKECKKQHCNKCAELTVEFCEALKDMGKDFWTCKECETKTSDLKAVLESIKDGQAKQEAERERVLEGLKAVEVVAKRLERVEDRLENQEVRLNNHDEAIKKNTRKQEEGEIRMKKLEKQMEEVGEKNHDGNDIRQFNAVVQEVREIKKRERNIVVFNVPEPTGEEEEEESNRDKIKEIFRELACEDIKPANAVRIGKVGRYPRQILTVLPSVDDCEKVMKKARDSPKLKDDIFITRDRTFKQRQEAKLFRMEKEKEEREGNAAHPGRGRGGRGRGRARGGGGGGRGRGSRGGRRGDSLSASRKRRNSNHSEQAGDAEDEAKRQKTGTGMGGGGGEAAAVTATQGSSDTVAVASQTPDRVKPTSEHQATPRSIPDSELGAVGGEEENF